MITLINSNGEQKKNLPISRFQGHEGRDRGRLNVRFHFPSYKTKTNESELHNFRIF